MTVYIGQDGRMRDDSLMHWKYIKKIKSGGGWRYFYTPEEVRAFYKESKQENESAHKKNLQSINDTYKRSMDQAKKHTMTFDYKNNRWRNLNKKEVETHRKNYAEPGRKKALRKESIRYKTGTAKNFIEKITSKPVGDISKSVNKGKSFVQSEARGVARVSKAIKKPQGRNYQSPEGKFVTEKNIYSKSGKTYRHVKEEHGGVRPGLDYTQSYSKSKKTGKAERAILKAYRKTPRGKRRWSLTR